MNDKCSALCTCLWWRADVLAAVWAYRWCWVSCGWGCPAPSCPCYWSCRSSQCFDWPESGSACSSCSLATSPCKHKIWSDQFLLISGELLQTDKFGVCFENNNYEAEVASLSGPGSSFCLGWLESISSSEWLCSVSNSLTSMFVCVALMHISCLHQCHELRKAKCRQNDCK